MICKLSIKCCYRPTIITMNITYTCDWLVISLQMAMFICLEIIKKYASQHQVIGWPQKISRRIMKGKIYKDFCTTNYWPMGRLHTRDWLCWLYLYSDDFTVQERAEDLRQQADEMRRKEYRRKRASSSSSRSRSRSPTGRDSSSYSGEPPSVCVTLRRTCPVLLSRGYYFYNLHVIK